jgi:amidohydrolase
MKDEIKKIVEQHKDQIIQTRRDLHKIPEVAHTEKKTADYIVERLEKEGISFESGIADYGILARMDCGGSGKTLMIRADMDALPVTEETGLPFSSTHEGNMHACGHDGHMAMLLGAITALGQLKDQLQGTIKFLFQPAEEQASGAKPLIDAGVMENPTVDYSTGIHLWPTVEQGKIGVKEGPLMAAMDRFDLKIIGKGGHGAMPHQCVDSIDVGAQVVNALQRMVSRKTNPLQPAVVTVGSFHSGKAFNVISGEAELSGTTRTFDRDTWVAWPEELDRVIRGVCDSMGADYDLNYKQGCPPLINDPSMAELVCTCAGRLVGEENVVEPEMTMGGEDMSYYLEKSKGCYTFLGIQKEGSYPIHNPKFDFNEEVLLTGVELYCHIALELLGK